MVIAVVAAAVLAALVISRGIARPIGALRAAALRIGQGDLSVKISRMSNDEVGDLAEAFDNMVSNLRDAKEKLMRSERLSVLGQVAGTVSHELRNPLASIQSSIDLMRAVACDKGPDLKRHLDRVDRNIERCDRIIGDLLEFTRIKELARQKIVFDPWIAELLDDHRPPEGIELRREFLANDIVADIDPIRFRQVLVNLIDNAAQALMEKGWTPNGSDVRAITVRTEVAGRQLRILIAENGPGIARDNLEKIFEPLFTTKSFGVGLGLPTVRQLVEQHGGSVDVESGGGLGTRFVICLPLPDSRADTGAVSVKVA